MLSTDMRAESAQLGTVGPLDTSDWLSPDCEHNLFGEIDNLAMPLSLSAEEEQLFDGFGESSSLMDHFELNGSTSEFELIMAEAAAAGLHRGTLRRQAFSTGDLLALQPAPEVAPVHAGPPPPGLSRGPLSGSSRALSRLESVPEGAAAAVPNLNRSTSYRMPDALELQSMSISQLQVELDRTRAAFESASGSSSLEHGVLPLSTGLSSVPFSAAYSTPAGSFPGRSSPTVPAAGSMDEAHTKLVQVYTDAVLQHGHCSAKAPMMVTIPPSPEVSPPQTTRSVLMPPLQGGQLSPTPKRVSTFEQFPAHRMPARRSLGRSQSAVDLHLLSSPSRRGGSYTDLQNLGQVTVELMTPEGHVYCVGKLSRAERAQKILKYRQKRHERNFTKRIKYQCRKTLADSRPRVRGRFARNDDAGAVQPHESRKALAAKKSHATKWSPLTASRAAAAVAVGASPLLSESKQKQEPVSFLTGVVPKDGNLPSRGPSWGTSCPLNANATSTSEFSDSNAAALYFGEMHSDLALDCDTGVLNLIDFPLDLNDIV